MSGGEGQVAALGRLMRAQQWWTMEPADGKLQAAGGEAFCLAGSKSWVIYVNPQENFSCRVQLERAMRLRWFNPREGEWAGPAAPVAGEALELEPPGAGDWVAVLR